MLDQMTSSPRAVGKQPIGHDTITPVSLLVAFCCIWFDLVMIDYDR